MTLSSHAYETCFWLCSIARSSGCSCQKAVTSCSTHVTSLSAAIHSRHRVCFYHPQLHSCHPLQLRSCYPPQLHSCHHRSCIAVVAADRAVILDRQTINKVYRQRVLMCRQPFCVISNLCGPEDAMLIPREIFSKPDQLRTRLGQ